MSTPTEGHSLIDLFLAGGFAMYPLVLCSFGSWAVIFERAMRFRALGRELQAFHFEAVNRLLRDDADAVLDFARRNFQVPTARLLALAIERRKSNDPRLNGRWREAVERARQEQNLGLRGHLWVLGTVASASPFIGLFGTVVGILQSFGDLARAGKGGFAVVAAGISEALIATAAGIVVAVVAAVAYNVFQTRLGALMLTVRNQTEELLELLSAPDRQAKES